MSDTHAADMHTTSAAETCSAAALDPDTFITRVKQAAAAAGLHVWDGLPTPAEEFSVGLAGADPEGFVALASRLGAKVLYTGFFPPQQRHPEAHPEATGTVPAGDDVPGPVPAQGAAAMFALEGIQHWLDCFPGTADAAGSDAAPPGRLPLLRYAGDTDPGLDELDDEEPVDVNGVTTLDDPYLDYRTWPPTPLPNQLRPIVDQLIANPRFDVRRHGSSELLDEATAQLSFEDRETVTDTVRRVFRVTVGERLDDEARRIAAEVVALDGYHPLMAAADIEELTAARLGERLSGVDPRVLARVPEEVSHLSWDRGLYETARRAAARRARALLAELDGDVRDQLGFTSRTNAREALLAPYLDKENRYERQLIASELKNLEAEKYTATREARYATASRALTASGMNRSAVSRELGISTAIMNRIESAHRRDVELTDEDPLLARSPRLRSLLGR